MSRTHLKKKVTPLSNLTFFRNRIHATLIVWNIFRFGRFNHISGLEKIEYERKENNIFTNPILNLEVPYTEQREMRNMCEQFFFFSSSLVRFEGVFFVFYICSLASLLFNLKSAWHIPTTIPCKHFHLQKINECDHFSKQKKTSSFERCVFLTIFPVVVFLVAINHRWWLLTLAFVWARHANCALQSASSMKNQIFISI